MQCRAAFGSRRGSNRATVVYRAGDRKMDWTKPPPAVGPLWALHCGQTALAANRAGPAASLADLPDRGNPPAVPPALAPHLRCQETRADARAGRAIAHRRTSGGRNLPLRRRCIRIAARTAARRGRNRLSNRPGGPREARRLAGRSSTGAIIVEDRGIQETHVRVVVVPEASG